jgi:hypothetical protein
MNDIFKELDNQLSSKIFNPKKCCIFSVPTGEYEFSNRFEINVISEEICASASVPLWLDKEEENYIVDCLLKKYEPRSVVRRERYGGYLGKRGNWMKQQNEIFLDFERHHPNKCPQKTLIVSIDKNLHKIIDATTLWQKSYKSIPRSEFYQLMSKRAKKFNFTDILYFGIIP